MIPVSQPQFGPKEHEYVSDCVRSGWVSSVGKYVDRFEAAWAAYCGRRYGVAVSSGTAALQVAFAALKLKPGDEVIMPSFTIISCAIAVLANGGVPVLVDSDPRTWCMDANQVAAKITPRTRAVMPVHIYGHPVDMQPLLDLAEKHRLAIVEDAAEAHGAEYRGRRCGGFGAMSCFSFYANKLLTTGEGGMVLTDDAELAERARSLRNLCLKADRRFSHDELGMSVRMTNLQAALGLAQTERVEELLDRKRRIAHEYTRRLKDLSSLQLPVEEPWAKNSYWVYGVLVSEKTYMDAAGLARKLQRAGVETRPFFVGMHEQPVFHFQNERYPVCERLSRQGLYLPSGTGITDAQVDQVCEAVRAVLS